VRCALRWSQWRWKQLDGDSEQMYQLQSTLTEIESTARSARMLFDYLERHPEALLRGKTQ
jgi:paraquat-inducible protein B